MFTSLMGGRASVPPSQPTAWKDWRSKCSCVCLRSRLIYCAFFPNHSMWKRRYILCFCMACLTGTPHVYNGHRLSVIRFWYVYNGYRICVRGICLRGMLGSGVCYVWVRSAVYEGDLLESAMKEEVGICMLYVMTVQNLIWLYFGQSYTTQHGVSMHRLSYSFCAYMR